METAVHGAVEVEEHGMVHHKVLVEAEMVVLTEVVEDLFQIDKLVLVVEMVVLMEVEVDHLEKLEQDCIHIIMGLLMGEMVVYMGETVEVC